jgi:hypothetical protein
MFPEAAVFPVSKFNAVVAVSVLVPLTSAVATAQNTAASAKTAEAGNVILPSLTSV